MDHPHQKLGKVESSAGHFRPAEKTLQVRTQSRWWPRGSGLMNQPSLFGTMRPLLLDVHARSLASARLVAVVVRAALGRALPN
jgi:hypothetical protein